MSKERVKSIAAGILILLGIQAVVFYYKCDMRDWWWNLGWNLGGNLAILYGLDWRYGKQQTIKKGE